MNRITRGDVKQSFPAIRSSVEPIHGPIVQNSSQWIANHMNWDLHKVCLELSLLVKFGYRLNSCLPIQSFVRQ